MLTDYFKESLYREDYDPFNLLWQLCDDALDEVKDNVCLQSYYISHQRFTLSGSPIEKNLTEVMAQNMYKLINVRHILRSIPLQSRRRRIITLLETATRLFVLLIIDTLLSQQPEEEKERYIGSILDQMRAVVRHLTFNGYLINLTLPVLTRVIRRQLTFQSDYVNNAVEYQHYWDALPSKDESNWCRKDVLDAMQFIFQYSEYYSKGRGKDAPDFVPFTDRIYKAYLTGDSFSYFVIERMLVINGVSSWDSVSSLFERLDKEKRDIRNTKWWDYSEMSIIYVLYQLGMNMEVVPDAVYDMLGRWCVDWTYRCRGTFEAPYSHKANSKKKYKRNVMTWYTKVSQRLDKKASLFYNLIDDAVDKKMVEEGSGGELMIHLVDNITELVTDSSGYVQQAIDLITHVMRKLDSEEVMKSMKVENTIPKQIAQLLSAAQTYDLEATNTFLTTVLPQLPFPYAKKYTNDLLNYTPCGEKLSDLITHRFGNFVMYALLHSHRIDQFFYDVAERLPYTANFFEWFNIVVRMLVRDLFKIKIKVKKRQPIT